MLTEQQQKVFDKMLECIEKKENYFLSSEDRNIGKTFMLNELAFTLQTLGYKVFVLTPCRACEYYGEKFISLDSQSYRGVLANNAVIIADEARFEMMEGLLDYCKYRSIPVVGYVNFRRSKIPEPIQFKREYECTWIK